MDTKLPYARDVVVMVTALGGTAQACERLQVEPGVIEYWKASGIPGSRAYAATQICGPMRFLDVAPRRFAPVEHCLRANDGKAYCFPVFNQHGERLYAQPGLLSYLTEREIRAALTAEG